MKKTFCIFLLIPLLSSCSISPRDSQTMDTSEAVFGEDAEALNISFCGGAEFQPHSQTSTSGRHALGFVYEPLFYISEEEEPVPVLAERIENRGMEADIYLRDGIRWHDGNSFSADDAAYSINLVASGRSVYKTDAIAEAHVKDRLCVTVTFSRRILHPETLFSFPVVQNNSPMSMAIPVGTGAFRYSGEDGFDTYVFSPYEDYKGQKKSFSALRMIRVQEAESEETLFQSGETDIFHVNWEKLCSYTPRANTSLYIYPTNQMIYIGFNTVRISEEVRKGINSVLDRDCIREKIFSYTAVTPQFAGDGGALSYHKSKPVAFLASEEELCLRILVQSDEKHVELARELSHRLSLWNINCTLTEPENFCEYLEKGDYDIIIGEADVSHGLYCVLYPGNPMFFDAELLPWSSTNDINRLLADKVPFIPVAFLCEGVSVSPKITSVLRPSYTFPYLGLVDG